MSAFYEIHEFTPDKADLEMPRGWRKEQLRRLWILIGMSFTGEEGAGKRWRMLKCYQIYRRRFWHLSKCNWVSFLGGFTDLQAIGNGRNKTLQKDLLRLRDTANYVGRIWYKEVI